MCPHVGEPRASRPHAPHRSVARRLYARRGASTNPGASRAKEFYLRGLAPVAPCSVRVREALPPFIVSDDSRQRISRLSHR